MIIAAHISSLKVASQLALVLNFLAEKNPGSEFIFLSETGSSGADFISSNTKTISVKPIKSNLGLRYWYNFTLPSLLKKNKVDLFISEDAICSDKINASQLIWLSNTSFLNKNAAFKLKRDSYRRKHFQKSADISKAILVKENFMKAQILKQYNLPEEKFHFVGEYFSASFKPMEWIDKDKLLNEFSEGTEYFYFECNAATKEYTTIVLKAFSLFKIRLKSGLKLLLHLNEVSLEDCVKDFRLYKYRNDVIVKDINDKDYTTAELVGGSYAVIHLPKEINGIGEIGLPAMISGIPIITTDVVEHNCLYRDAALFNKPNEQSIADNMMLLYKDENLRAKYIEKGLELTTTHTLPASAERLWQTILATLPENAQ